MYSKISILFAYYFLIISFFAIFATNKRLKYKNYGNKNDLSED
jgi:hypothetical protein